MTLDSEKLRIVDPAQLERGLADVRTDASVAINHLEHDINGGKVKRNDEIFKPAIDDTEKKIALAKKLGIDVTDLEERFKQCVDE